MVYDYVPGKAAWLADDLPWEGERPVDDRAGSHAVRDLDGVDLDDMGILLGVSRGEVTDRAPATVRPDAAVADVKRLLAELDGPPVHVTTSSGRWLGQITAESMRLR